MPEISLVVCIFGQRDLLARLLAATENCFDELIVVHDGPEPETLRDDQKVETLVSARGGRFFVGPRAFQQEPHWPMAWQEAKHDWILRLDADELPSAGLREWLMAFRAGADPSESTAGFTCIWPLWDGNRIVTRAWPANRQFLFHKGRVRFFGMAEQSPVPDATLEPLPLVLEHRPNRTSYGFGNLLLRPQAYEWRRVIVRSLLNRPTDLSCWRWVSGEWPPVWREIRERPLRTGFKRLLGSPLRTAQDMRRAEGRIILSAVASSGIHHCLIALGYWRACRSRRPTQ